jgi:hypothetical protein
VQMSMIDTWAATGCWCVQPEREWSYTLEGWRAFLKAINNDGIFTVSRWYNPGEINETGRMIGLATAALLDSGVKDARSHLFVAHADHIATLVLSKMPFNEQQLRLLHDEVLDSGFIAWIDKPQADASPHWRDDVAIEDVQSLSVNQRLIGLYRAFVLPHDIGLILCLLPSD